jgi:hypothetical protein
MKKIIKKVKAKTKVERRIEILKDVLAQLRLEKYKATIGSYIRLPKELYAEKLEKASAQDTLLACTKACQVCAKGSIFLSTVRKENKLTLDELHWDNYDDTNRGTQRVIKLFGQANLDLIEAAFEKWLYKDDEGEYHMDDPYGDYDCYYGASDPDPKLEAFVKKYPDKTKRLEAIITNCIANKGIFKL